MRIFRDLQEWIAFRPSLSDDLGFVPTMGNLHAGHASLFLKSSSKHQATVSTLFVNPTQFNQLDDFTQYPRTLEADIELMTHSGVDFCILPQKEEIYADGYNYQIQEQNICQLMEGTHRPGHFNGVLTVVMKLLNLVGPKTAYFGEKDYQQYLLISKMVQAFFMNIEIKAEPTIREASGLPYSSRNNRLTEEQRILAQQFAKIFHQNIPCHQIIEELTQQGIQVDYVEEHLNRRFAAVYIGTIRLIDNYLVSTP